MKKMVTLTIVTAISTLLLVGCSTKKEIISPEHSRSGGYEIPIPAHTKKSTLHDAIMQAGEENGWVMTEFRSSSIIAEKINGTKSASATISFSGEKLTIVKNSTSPSCSPSKYDSHIDKLQDAIFEILQSGSAH
ncbi:MAG: hypothetical protein U9R50_03370 [Campylobacterota bacterium]|nr:hypothetical protein [Campylobacterota bacterium]